MHHACDCEQTKICAHGSNSGALIFPPPHSCGPKPGPANTQDDAYGEQKGERGIATSEETTVEEERVL
jgi:hypothetical protein